MATSYLVLIETAGNQAFIFATNKLRENVGASQMTHLAGKEFIDAAVKTLSDTERGQVREVVSTSGKAILRVPSIEIGKAIIREVMRRALKEAPGLDVRGAISTHFDFDQSGTIHTKITQVHERHAELGSFVPGPRERFLRLPVVADCATSGLPAMKMAKDGDKPIPIPISKVTEAKREAANAGWNRIRNDVGSVTDDDTRRLRLAPGPEALDKMDLNWLAVIHADGNGFGKIFLKFQEYLPGGRSDYANTTYTQKLKEFSDGLDKCTLAAFRTALERMAASWSKVNQKREKEEKYLPVVPLILGGDDLTVVCDGRYAVQLTRDFLRAFEIAAEKLVRDIGFEGKLPPLGACAGIAIVKPHYPFYAAYELAEELLRSAKKLKAFGSALDFHILYDASGSKLESIRDKLSLGRVERADGTTGYHTKLVARPYVVTPSSDAPRWRRIDDLAKRVTVLRQRNLPRGMLHELREGLFLGVEAAEARLMLARGRHGNALDGILHDERLFFDDGERHQITGFLDALDLAEFWETEDQP